jgi:hypothetical protein
MRQPIARAAVCLLMLACAPSAARGQAVGTTTGIIDGVITDASGAVVPRAVVTASGDALMVARSAESSLEGRYRLATLPPGQYTLTFSAAGMTTVRQEGIYVGVGASVSFDITLIATVNESVIVSREAPTIDRQSPVIVTTFDASHLAALPGARSMWFLIAAAPGVFVGRTDVGGNEAATGLPFHAYGMRGGSRPTIEGIVVAGISGTGFTPDYGSFEEATIGTGAHAAELAVAGLQMQFTTKSGGSRYSGTVYADYEDQAWQSFNVTDDQIQRDAPGTDALPPREVNRLSSYSDVNTDIGGFIRRNAAWWYSSFRRQEVSAMSVNFPVEPVMTRMTSGTAKVTLRPSPVHRFVAFGQIGGNRQPNRLEAFTPAGGGGVNTRLYESAATADQRLLGWIWKGEWTADLRDDLFLEARAGSFAINRSQHPRAGQARFEDVATLLVSGGNRTWQERLRNNQVHGSIDYFPSDRFGSHHVKAGGSALRRTADETWKEGYPGDVLHVLRNGEPIEVYFFQTPSTAKSGLWIYSSYATDSWRIRNRLTLNLGIRFERWRVFLPEQTHEAQPFPAVDSVVAWNVAAPRLGASLDLAGDGRTVLKVNYGRYTLSPGLDTGFNASPNTNPWWERHEWTDSNQSGEWEPDEQGRQLARRGGTTAESLDPNLELPFLHELAAWIERELPARISLRSGVVWRGERQHYARQNISRPYEAFTVPYTLPDPGADGIAGTPDDGAIQAYGPAAEYDGIPIVNMVRNVPNSDSRYVTWDLNATRRFSGRWSLMGGFAYMWNRDHASAYSGQSIRANTYPVTPNDLINASRNGQYVFTIWNAKLHGTYVAPRDIQLTPSLRLQSGQPFGRTLSASIPGLGNTRILAEPIGTRRMDRIVMMDVRAEKGFRAARGRAALFVDVFNLFNSNAEQNLSWTSGSSFLRPLDIVAPRIFRLGARLDW